MRIEFLRPDRPLSRQQATAERYADWDHIAEPFSAAKQLPDWFMELPGFTSFQQGTVKRCPPFLDALTCGYLIPFPDWAEIKLNAGQKWDKRGPGQIFLGSHFLEQFAGTWFEDYPIIKFDSPWIIRTPKGYSTLFIAPFNRDTFPFRALSGIVETDNYYHAVSFPMIYLQKEIGSVHRLEKGTPLVQAIPFKRDTWELTIGESDDEQWAETRDELKTHGINAYKNLWHQKKSYD